MRSFLRSLIVLSILIVGTAWPTLGTAQAPSDNARFGIVNASRNPEAANDSGAGWEIVTLHWDQIQSSGPTDWNTDPQLDQWLATARSQSREVVAVVIGTPAWATSGSPVIGVPRGLYLPVNDPGNTWAGFMGRAATYYGAQGINRWVIWRNPDDSSNDPNTTWEGSIEEYYQLVKDAYLSAKVANPNALIHLAGVGNFDPNWFSQFIEIALDDPTGPANNYYFDVATLHIYDSPDEVFTLMQNDFFVMNQKGFPPKEVWINEMNARPAVDPAYPADQVFRSHSKITQEQQASFIIQGYALAFAANRGARVAVYQLADDFEADKGEAFGLVRKDGSERPAFHAYQLAAEQFNGFVFARRIEDPTHPLIDYVRLTFQSKVTHIAWALTEQTATLIIPARTTQATLIDVNGNRWTVEAEGGVYRLVVGGADCNDPATGCLIGGAPWMLVEDGIQDAVNAEPPDVTVEQGGTLPTPDPNAALTAAPSATPTLTPSETPTEAPATIAATEESTKQATAELVTATQESTAVAEITGPQPTEQVSGPKLPSPRDLRPRGFGAILPFILMGLGALVIGGGAWYFFAGHQQISDPTAWEHLKVTQENERIAFSGEVEESLISTGLHEYPEFPEEADHDQQITAEHEPPDLPDVEECNDQDNEE